jgi:hypothetical protein
MTTQGIRTLQEKTRAIQSAAIAFHTFANDALAAKFASPDDPAADELPIPDWETLQLFIAKRLEIECARLAEAAEKHARQVQAEPRKRQERDAATRAAYEGLVRVRSVLTQALGKTQAYALLGVQGRTPERPRTLLCRLRAASAGLRQAERRPDALDLPGMTLDWDELADALDRDADRLDAVLSREGWDKRRADLALLHKDEVQASVNDTYVGFAKILEGMYIAAGERELASRLRPTRRAAVKKRSEKATAAEAAAEASLGTEAPAKEEPPVVTLVVGGPAEGARRGVGRHRADHDAESRSSTLAVERPGDGRPHVQTFLNCSLRRMFRSEAARYLCQSALGNSHQAPRILSANPRRRQPDAVGGQIEFHVPFAEGRGARCARKQRLCWSDWYWWAVRDVGRAALLPDPTPSRRRALGLAVGGDRLRRIPRL